MKYSGEVAILLMREMLCYRACTQDPPANLAKKQISTEKVKELGPKVLHVQ